MVYGGERTALLGGGGGGATTVDGIEVLVRQGALSRRSGPAASRRLTRCAPPPAAEIPPRGAAKRRSGLHVTFSVGGEKKQGCLYGGTRDCSAGARVAGVCLGALFLTASTRGGGGDTYHAAPLGEGGACSAATPCQVGEAVDKAQEGD